MGPRFGWLTALAAIALAMGRLVRLIEPAPDSRGWLPFVIAGTLIGVIVSLAGVAARIRPWFFLPIQLVGIGLAFCRVAAADTLAFSIVPTASTWPVVADEMRVALELIRYGSAPVTAATGLVAVLTIVFWAMGGLAAYGLVRGKPLWGTVPALGFYMLSATFDRQPPQWWWPAALVAVGAAGLLAATNRAAGGRARAAGSGRVIPANGRLLPSITILALALGGAGAVNRFSATVPESGMVAWRNPTGFGGGLFGGLSYNLFTNMQQDLAGSSPVVVFVARVSESAPGNSQLYWKLITLDDYDGNHWLPANLAIRRPVIENDFEASDFRFRGPSVRVEGVVRIEALRQNYLPLIYSPRSLQTDDELLSDSYRAREDGSIKFDARSNEGLTYRITSEIPAADLSVLATQNGVLSPMFARAQAAGLFTLAPRSIVIEPASNRIREVYSALPEEFPSEIGRLARLVTQSTTTDYERGVVLEEFFRSYGGFRYDASASSGHSILDMKEWLLDASSLNYRIGYCEQFASAMALMARTLAIPARVVLGFAPGTVQTQADGSPLIVVRALNAHAWVELYIEGHGWLRFDPTPRVDGINPPTLADIGFSPTQYLPEPVDPIQTGGRFPGTGEEIGPDVLPEGFDPAFGDPAGINLLAPEWGRIGLIALGLIALVPVLRAIKRRSRLDRLEHGDVAAGWKELVARLTDLGYRVSPSWTPTEVAVFVDNALLPLARRVNASVYGGRRITDGLTAYQNAERALRIRYPAWKWWLTWVLPPPMVGRLLGNRPPTVSGASRRSPNAPR